MRHFCPVKRIASAAWPYARAMPLKTLLAVGTRVTLFSDRSRFAWSLLDDEEFVVSRHYVFEVGYLVAGQNDKLPTIGSQALVVRDSHRNRFCASRVPALADVFGALVTRNVLDPLVHLAEERFVRRDAFGPGSMGRFYLGAALLKACALRQSVFVLSEAGTKAR